MSENMQELKRRMKSIESTEHITNAMRLVSSSKYKKAKYVFDKTNEQIKAISQTMEQIIASAEKALEESGQDDEQATGTGTGGAKAAGTGTGKRLIVAIAGNKGLCGGFNGNMIRKTVAIAEEKPKEDIEIYAIGSRCADYFDRNGYEIAGSCNEAPEKMDFAAVREIARPIIDKFLSGEASEVLLVHTAYINSLRQEPVVKKLLPLDSSDFDGGVKELELTESPKEILGYMVPKYFELVLFAAITESAACEYAARRTAMENATDNANEMLDKLSLTFNRVRQAAITNELIEIVSGAESQK